MIRRALAAGAAALVPATASAHPGHGTLAPDGLLHQLLDHPLSWVAAALLVLAVGVPVARARRPKA